ncbi:MAG: lytic transglycosylase domain-containing protein [Alphaproteobacteria bacterium TMED93]|nr:MAG: lytic transglycosylase domain-containing protein [Alphaproteobacteria bacterium TMED93]
MSYFKFLVILISFFFSNHIVSSDKLSFDDLYLSKSDLKFFKASLKEGDKTKWARSLTSGKKINNKVAKKIIKWRWLTAQDGLTDINTLKQFYLENRNWPKQYKIKEKIESKISIKNDKVEMLWFQENPPKSGIGKIKLAEMLIKNNFKNEGFWLLNEAWKNNTFSYSEEKYILTKFKNKISKVSHNQRIEELIWNRTWGSARRQLKRVNNDIKLFSTAKITLSRRRGNVDNVVKKVPKKYLSYESLIYERIKWRRRAKLEKSSFELLLSYKGNITKPDRWWKEVNYHSRKQMRYKNYKSSINLLKNFNNNTNTFSYQSSWLIGWLSLTFEKDPKTAYESFTKMFENVRTPISKARSSYWAGKSAEITGDSIAASLWYDRAAAFPSTFYGQLAIKKNGKKFFIPDLSQNISDDDIKGFFKNPLIKALIILNQANHKKLFKVFTRQIIKDLKNTKETILLINFLNQINKTSLAIYTGRKAIYKNIYLPSLNYPLPKKTLLETYKKDSYIPLNVALAITRQESAFEMGAISRAGARGLMQLMPRTARVTAKKINYKYSRKNLTTSPSYNIKLGTFYFKEMLDKFNGSYVLALASYNAGPNRVKRWLKTYGDPRKNEIDQVTWIELIPISETRNYVQRVLEGIYMYGAILNKEKNITSKHIKFF